MKTEHVTKNVVYLVCSILILGLSGYLLYRYPEADGMLATLPFLLLGIGSGILGGNASILIRHNLMKKDPEASRRLKIEENDERNIAINQCSKAKAYDASTLIYGILMLYFALIGATLSLLLPLVGCYLLCMILRLYYLYQCQKKM